MARVVIRDAQLERMSLCPWRALVEEFRDVATFGSERFRFRRVIRIVAQQVTVLLHVRATAGRIRDDEFDVGAIEDIDRSAGELKRTVFFTGMNHEGATAWLIGGSDDFEAFCGKNARS